MVKHGKEPYNIIVIHGGPGAVGTANGLSKIIGKYCGAIELYNYENTIEKQIKEIEDTVKKFKMSRPILVGHSWGAWLAYLAASKSDLYKKIILIGSGAFDSKYLKKLNSSRQNKLNEEEKKIVNEFFLSETTNFKEVSYLLSKMDGYDIKEHEGDMISFDFLSFDKLMKELNVVRNNNELLENGKNIKCDIEVIHGLNDSHPYEGVINCFTNMNYKFKYYLIDKCGHTPWNEKYAYLEFEEIIENILK